MGIIKQELYDHSTRSAANVFSMLGHPGRIKIIELLKARERLTLGEIQDLIGLSQSATSDQIKKLKESGLLRGVRVETSVYYSLSKEQWELMVIEILEFMNGFNECI